MAWYLAAMRCVYATRSLAVLRGKCFNFGIGRSLREFIAPVKRATVVPLPPPHRFRHPAIELIIGKESVDFGAGLWISARYFSQTLDERTISTEQPL